MSATDSKIATAAKKPNFWLMPLIALIGVLRVFAYGVKKHGKKNYLKAAKEPDIGEVVERYCAAMMRHLDLWQRGEIVDIESGLPHLDHVIAGSVMMRHILIESGTWAEDPGQGNEPPSSCPGAQGEECGVKLTSDDKLQLDQLKKQSMEDLNASEGSYFGQPSTPFLGDS